jgi:hypothetical protein
MRNKITEFKHYLANQFGGNYGAYSESFLRFETSLGTSGVLNFAVNANEVVQPNSAVIPTEARLAQGDIFVVTHIKFDISEIASDTPSAAQLGNRRRYFWPNTGIFAGTNQANLWTIYNGYLSVQVDNVKWLPQIPMDQFLRIAETQQTVNQAAATATSENLGDSQTNGMWGYCPCDPFALDGNKKNVWQVTLPNSVAIDDSSLTTYASFTVKGYLGNGIANLKK